MTPEPNGKRGGLPIMRDCLLDEFSTYEDTLHGLVIPCLLGVRRDPLGVMD